MWPLCIDNTLHLNRNLYDILKARAHAARAVAADTAHTEERLAGGGSGGAGGGKGGKGFGLESSAALIETDLSRTMAQLRLFDSTGPYDVELRDVLEAYCFYRPDVGYVQVCRLSELTQ